MLELVTLQQNEVGLRKASQDGGARKCSICVYPPIPNLGLQDKKILPEHVSLHKRKHLPPSQSLPASPQAIVSGPKLQPHKRLSTSQLAQRISLARLSG